MSENRTRVAVVQARSALFETDATLRQAGLWIEKAAVEHGSQLIVVPEAFLGGYPRGAGFGTWVGARTASGREDFHRYFDSAVEVPGPETDELCALAAKHGTELVVGVIERAGSTLYCSAVFVGADGSLRGVHRKLQPTGSERLIWGQGDGSTLRTFETPIGRVGAAICWENLMPSLRMALYGQGVEFWCAPTADARDGHIATMRHIALEGRCFVLAANQFMTRADYPSDYDSVLPEDPEEIVCRGGSVIVGPLGDVLAGPLYDTEGILTAEVDRDDIVRSRFDFDPVGHYARPDVFQLHVNTQRPTPVAYAAPQAAPSAAVQERTVSTKGDNA